jgi:uncharacterized membrane protein YgaE (UPF0421/DUF939 family)
VNTVSAPDQLLAPIVVRLRRLGLGERVIKTAIAAGLSWQLASWVPGNDYPYLAPVTAVLLMQLTIAQSLESAVQRIIGVAIGVIVAVVTFQVLGLHIWSISLVVLIALAGGIQLRLSQQGVQQVAISALIVLLAGSLTGTFSYAVYRIGDSLIGAAVSLGLNWVLVPPVFVSPARAAIERMSHELATVLADLTASLRSGMTGEQANEHLLRARAMASSLADANAALTQAETSLRFNRIARGQRGAVSDLHVRSTALEHSAIQTRVLCRSIATAYQEEPTDWLQPDRFGRALADLFGRNTVLVRYVGGDRLGVRPQIPSTVALQHAMHAWWQDRDDGAWRYAGEILAVAERMARELDSAIDASSSTQ